jgi:lysophospholipase L1-like esterase
VVRLPMAALGRVVAWAAATALTLTAAAALAVAPTHAPADPDPPHAVDLGAYVALGDSYTAGPLIPRTAPALGCFRSTHNYPAMLAAALDVEKLTDVSCSGADTTHLTSPQPTGFATVPPQLAALSRDTDLVTIGIGGNDFDVFGRLVGVCPRVRAKDPDGAPCRARFHHTGRDTLLAALARTRDRLDRALAQVRRAAPNARVFVIGYPRMAPASGTCPDVLPFADGDYRYADRVERRLNTGLRHAAHVNGAGFVDTYRASRGHDACAGADAWVNGGRTDPARAQSYHPFRAYMAAVADLVDQRLRG